MASRALTSLVSIAKSIPSLFAVFPDLDRWTKNECIMLSVNASVILDERSLKDVSFLDSSQHADHLI